MNKLIIFITGLLLFAGAATAKAAYYVVAADGSGNYTTVQAAIDACAENTRSYIFIKNGTYYGAASIGTKTASTNKFISIIGENRDSVILTYDVYCTSTITYEQACTFKSYAKNFYAENITIRNTTGKAGIALALFTSGDMSVLKNCNIVGYQDTYRSKKSTRTYLLNCLVEGAVDFIYAGGTLIFDDCTINCTKAGGYVVAPEDCKAYVPAASTAGNLKLNLGFLFRNCTVQGPSSVAANSFYLGRPWGENCGAAYLNCKLSNQVHTDGWGTMGASTYLTSCFAEYNSTYLNGTPIDATKRVSWSYQLLKKDVDDYLSPTAFYANGFSGTFDPFTLIAQTAAPANLQLANGTLSWSSVTGASLYVVYRDNRIADITSSTSVKLNGNTSNIAVRSLNALGVLSEPASLATGLQSTNINEIMIMKNKSLIFNDIVSVKIINSDGRVVVNKSNIKEININSLNQGNYIVSVQCGKLYSTKLHIAN